MPSIPLQVNSYASLQRSPEPKPQSSNPTLVNPLPQLLQTPSGLALLEIQGTIHAPFTKYSASPLDETSSTSTSSSKSVQTDIGRLEFPFYDPSENGNGQEGKWMKRVYLYVGKHQRLTGEAKKLGKPLAVIRKSQTELPDQDTEALEIVEVVKYKIIFAGRPEPVSGEV